MKQTRFPIWQWGPIALRAPSSGAIKGALLAVVLLGAALLLSLMLGHQGLAPVSLAKALFAEASDYENWLLWQSRLPRALCALGAGMALGLSGAVFQSLSRNPLGSPDILGVNAGASAGAVLWLLWLPELPLLPGALLGTGVVLLLFFAGLGRQWQFSRNLVLMGIAINAFAIALVQFVLTLVQREQAQQMLGYLSGSLAHRTWGDVLLITSVLLLALPALLLLSRRLSQLALLLITSVLLLALPALLLLSRRLSQLALGQELAQALGNPVRQSQTLALLFATLLALGAVLCAGPVAFVALVAPHLARFGNRQLALLRSALIGALLLLGADTLTLLLPGNQRLPVGVLTALIGGAYLALLLSREIRGQPQLAKGLKGERS